ncbi:hypothetical protein DY000_02058546 [Brassica cretica]|uniref:Uncharacterized protein n=1 Tax=Brassica cretica TaxID=69181 RepID=A0ABQ7AVZ4_BRACR|nr:hypothetical protein DY000_02058546 [Brassica cretica]
MTRKLQTCNSAEEHTVLDFKNTRTQRTAPHDSILSHSFTEHSRTQEQEHKSKNTRTQELEKERNGTRFLNTKANLALIRYDFRE